MTKVAWRKDTVTVIPWSELYHICYSTLPSGRDALDVILVLVTETNHILGLKLKFKQYILFIFYFNKNRKV